MRAKDNRTYYADMAAPRRHNRQSAVWLLLLLLCLGGAWLGQNRLGGQSAPVNNVLSNADGIIQSVQSSGKWPSRLMADSEALFAWRRYQQDLAKAAAEIRVAVYCTHSSETYTSYSGQPKVYGELGGIYQAAHAFADTLQAEGVGVLVNETIHDWPDWNKAYANSLATAEGLLAAYPNLQVLIDWHRDAGVSREASVVDINGRTAARIMLVCGSAQRYENPNWQSNRDFMQRLGDKMDELYPGLLRRISVQAGRYNQHIFDHAILVEMGSTENNIEEVEYAATLLAEAMRQVLAEE